MDTSSLMEQILSKDNLNAAYLQVVRNKGAAGVDGMTVEELGAYLSENGYENDFSETRLHHEIYLSDPRKTEPEKRKTVIRHPIRKKQA